MAHFSHENLRVYQKVIEFVAWSQPVIESLPAKTSARDQLERASTSVPLNIAEGNVKASDRDRARFWQIALGSAVECAAVLDVLVASRLKADSDILHGKSLLQEVVRMLMTMLANLGTRISEEPVQYETCQGAVGDEDEDRR